mgnify:CR=1 FL=1
MRTHGLTQFAEVETRDTADTIRSLTHPVIGTGTHRTTRALNPLLFGDKLFPLLSVLVRIKSHVTEKCDTLLWRTDEEETLHVY